MPIDALVLFGCFGFSSNSIILPSSSVFMMPNLDACSSGTFITAIVAAAPIFLWYSSIAE